MIPKTVFAYVYFSFLFFIWSTFCSATTGYFALGYGAKSVSMAGATVAAPQDSMVAAVNPAGITLVGDRNDLALRFFNPNREAELDPRVVGGQFKVDEKSSRTWFFIPQGGVSRQFSDNIWGGLTVYANGGLNTSYRRNIYDESAAVLGAFAVGGPDAAASVPEGTGTGAADTGRLGVDLAQVIFAPTIAFKFHPKHSLGLSALIAVQRFNAKGLGNFQCFTKTAATNNPSACSPGGFGPLSPGFIASRNLTNRGHEISYGGGVRVGWVGEIHPKVTLGASIASKIYMTKFDDYAELFAEGGDFDIPANFVVGIALRPIDNFLVAFDYQRIFYSDVRAIGNKGPVSSPFGPTIPGDSGFLGENNGLGFGWKDINIYRIGLEYQFDRHLVFRAGYSWNNSPIPDNQLLFNILSLAVNKKHATLGLTYSPDDSTELTLAYMHAFHASQEIGRTAFGIPGAIDMNQNSIELAYSWKF